MNNALLISLIGGGMVFIGLILLWLMMVVLVKLTSRTKKLPEKLNHPAELEISDLDRKQKAAIAAVGTAMALFNATFSTSSHKRKEIISPWQQVHRNRQRKRSQS